MKENVSDMKETQLFSAQTSQFQETKLSDTDYRLTIYEWREYVHLVPPFALSLHTFSNWTPLLEGEQISLKLWSELTQKQQEMNLFKSSEQHKTVWAFIIQGACAACLQCSRPTAPALQKAWQLDGVFNSDSLARSMWIKMEFWKRNLIRK